MTSPTPTPAAPPTPTDPIPSLIPPAATTTISATPTPAQAPATNDAPAPAGGGLPGAVLPAGVAPPTVSGSTPPPLARRPPRLEERARVRTTLAEAYQAYADYKEFPYAIRR